MSKTRHIEASYPGELVGIDTFYVGCLKNDGEKIKFRSLLPWEREFFLMCKHHSNAGHIN